MKKNKYFIVVGQFSLVLGLLGYIINSLYLENAPVLAFITGFLLGLSLVLNLTYLIQTRKGKKV
jgi:hypothetical protein